MQVPREKLVEIADQLDMKMKCFVHRNTLEIVSFPDEDLILGDFDEEVWQEEIQKIEKDPNSYIIIDRMASWEKFKIMEDFAQSVKENWVRIKLLEALQGKKPFAHFNHSIHNMPEYYKKAWFSFKQEREVEFISLQLNFENT
jgi:hypothetical protein